MSELSDDKTICLNCGHEARLHMHRSASCYHNSGDGEDCECQNDRNGIHLAYRNREVAFLKSKLDDALKERAEYGDKVTVRLLDLEDQLAKAKQEIEYLRAGEQERVTILEMMARMTRDNYLLQEEIVSLKTTLRKSGIAQSNVCQHNWSSATYVKRSDGTKRSICYKCGAELVIP